jgi:iron complex outermembrane receptor protein
MQRRLTESRWLALPLLLLGSAQTAAQEPQAAVANGTAASPEGAPSERGLSTLSLEDLLQIRVTVASRDVPQRVAEAPSIVFVITAEEIEARGYTSLAEVLRVVPGFYDVYDGVTHNIGVRGINGGQNASGNVIKLMIDGHPVDYRPTTGNFFGEELIPLAVVERVEIIRGPASALYGANAFLGVVNVITRSGASFPGVRLIGHGILVRDHPGGGGGLAVGGVKGPIDVLIAGEWRYLDRSGLGIPPSSPALASDATLRERGPSQNDTARPATLFAKLAVSDVLHGKLTFFASLQNLDAHGEYQSFSQLRHDTRIASLNQNYRAVYQVSPLRRLTLRLGGHYFNAGPTGQERLDIGNPDYLPVRSTGADGGGVDTEARIVAHRRLTFTIGADFVQENYALQTFDKKLLADVLLPSGEVLRKAGTIIPGEQHGAHTVFRNSGIWTQGILSLPFGLSAVAGLRIDVHSLFGVHASPRAALVWAPERGPVSLKLLYGASFKAPSAEQLYTQPITVFDVQGNPSLQAQTAHTLELAGDYRLPQNRGQISVNVFATDVLARAEFLPTGTYLQAANIQSEWVMGGELDSRVVIVPSLRLRFVASLAHTVARSLGSSIPDQPEVLNELFPFYQFHLIGDYTLPFWGLLVSAELSYIGPRPASLDAALGRGAGYELPGYPYAALALALPERKIIPGRTTRAALRISNLFNTQFNEPGFGGIDIPNQGITVILTVVQQL